MAGAVTPFRSALSSALPSSRSLTRPMSSSTVRVPDVTARPSTVARSSGPMDGVENTRPTGRRRLSPAGTRNWSGTLLESVESVQRGCRPPGHQGAVAEVQEAGQQAAPPVQGGAHEVEGARPVDHQQSAGHAPRDPRVAQAGGERLVPGDDLALEGGDGREASVGVVHGPGA